MKGLLQNPEHGIIARYPKNSEIITGTWDEPDMITIRGKRFIVRGYGGKWRIFEIKSERPITRKYVGGYRHIPVMPVFATPAHAWLSLFGSIGND